MSMGFSVTAVASLLLQLTVPRLVTCSISHSTVNCSIPLPFHFWFLLVLLSLLYLCTKYYENIGKDLDSTAEKVYGKVAGTRGSLVYQKN